MIKSVAGLLSLLFAISSLYYLFFWSRFGIDAFQYIAIEDIIKGVAYAMKPGILLAMSFLLALAIALAREISIITNNTETNYSVEREVILLRRTIFTTFVVILLVFSYIYTIYDTQARTSICLLTIIAYLTPFVSFLFSITFYRLAIIYFEMRKDEINLNDERSRHWLAIKLRKIHKEISTKSPKSPYNFAKVINYSVIGLIFYFLTSAILLGALNAEKIIQKSSYDYAADIRPKDIPGKGNRKLIYLGAISTKYIFSDTLISSYFIINRDSMPLHIYHSESLKKN